MPFQDLDELLGSPKKELPVGGRLLTFPDRISAETGMVLLRISQRAKDNPEAAQDGDALVADLLDDDGWQAVQTEVMGRTPEEMLADGLMGDRAAHVFKTLIIWHVYGREAAEKAWSQVGNPPAPNRATRRASKAPAKSNPGRGSRAGSTTPEPDDATALGTPGPNSSTAGN